MENPHQRGSLFRTSQKNSFPDLDDGIFVVIEQHTEKLFWRLTMQDIIFHTHYPVHQNILLLLIPKIIFNLIGACPANSLCMVFFRVIVPETVFAFQSVSPVLRSRIRMSGLQFDSGQNPIPTNISCPVSNSKIVCCVNSADKILFKECTFLFTPGPKLCIRPPIISRKVSFLLRIKEVKNFFQKISQTHCSYHSRKNN